MPKRKPKPAEGDDAGKEPEPAAAEPPAATPAPGDAWEQALALKKQRAESGWPFQQKQKREKKKHNPGRG